MDGVKPSNGGPTDIHLGQSAELFVGLYVVTVVAAPKSLSLDH